MSRSADLTHGQQRKLASGLLAAANSELFHRYEAEESRATALQERYDRMRIYLEDTTKRLTQIVSETDALESDSAQRTSSIRQQLDRLDREETKIEARIRHRKRDLLAVSAQLAVNRIALAFNFELEPSGSRRVDLGPRDAQEVVGFSTYTDEQGCTHRVEFTAGGDERSATATAHSSNASECSDAQSPLVTSVSKSHRDYLPGNAAHQEIIRKRASFLLLDQAKAQVLRAVQSVENDFRDGRIHEFEHQALRGPLQLRLGEIRRAMEHIAGIVPSTPTPPSAERGSPKAAASRSLQSLLSFQPAVDDEFRLKFDVQRRALQDLRRSIAQEEELLGQKEQLGEAKWVDAVAARDREEFAETRREGTRQRIVAHSDSAFAEPLPWPCAARTAAGVRPASASQRATVDNSSCVAPQPPAAKLKAARPNSASLVRRYGEAAKSVLAQDGDKSGAAYERIVMSSALGESAPRPSEGAGHGVYRFSTHEGLEAAAKNSMRYFNRQVYM